MLLIPGIVASRKGAFRPTDLAGLQLWLDADDASTFSYSSGSVVSQWNDKSTNAYHFTQATVANQPTRNTNQQNGRAVVTFNVDSLANTTLNWGGSNSTVFWVGKEDDPAGQGFQNLFTTGTGATGQWSYGIMANFVGNTYGIFDIGQGATSLGFTPTGTNADVMAFTSAGVTGTATVTVSSFKNGTAGAGNPYTSATTTTSAAGAVLSAAAATSEPYYGTVCEVIVYNSQLSTTDRNKVEDYLKTKWATP